MSNVEADDLLNQVFAASINLPALRSSEKPSSHGGDKILEAEGSLSASENENVPSAKENLENLEKAEELQTVNQFTAKLTTSGNIDHTDEINPGNVLTEHTVAVGSIEDDNSFDAVVKELEKNGINQEIDDGIDYVAETMEKISLHEEDRAKDYDEENKSENYEAKVEQEMEFIEKMSEASYAEPIKPRKSRAQESYETVMEKEKTAPLASEKAERQEGQFLKKQEDYVKTYDLEATTTEFFTPEKKVSDMKDARSVPTLKSTFERSFGETFVGPVECEPETIYEKKPEESPKEEQKAVKDLLRVFSPQQIYKKETKKTMKGIPDNAWIQREEIAQETAGRLSALHSSADKGLSEVSVSSRGTGYQSLKLPTENDKFQSIRVVKNVRQFVKTWGQTFGSNAFQKNTEDKSRTGSIKSQLAEQQQISEKEEPKEQDEGGVITRNVPVSQRRRNFENKGWSGSPNVAQLKELKEVTEEVPETGEIFETGTNVVETNGKNTAESELEKLGSIKQRRLFFERQSRIANQ